MPGVLFFCFACLATSSVATAEDAFCHADLVFPLHPQHNHAPGLVECPNGDLLASWYRDSGEREADDVAVYGARLKKGATQWSDAFPLVDTPGFPDGNTAMHIDRGGRLPCRHTTSRRAALWTFENLDTFRQTLLHRAGRLIRPQGVLTLTLNANSWLRNQFRRLLSGLQTRRTAA